MAIRNLKLICYIVKLYVSVRKSSGLKKPRGLSHILQLSITVGVSISKSLSGSKEEEKPIALGHRSRKRKTEIDPLAAMFSRLGGRGYQMREGTGTYGQCETEAAPAARERLALHGDNSLEGRLPHSESCYTSAAGFAAEPPLP